MNYLNEKLIGWLRRKFRRFRNGILEKQGMRLPFQYAKELLRRGSSSVKAPAILGAVFDLGYCMDLTDQINEDAKAPPFDSVKGVFWEGGKLYPGAEFTEKNHIQICVRNPNCIKGFFLPRKLDFNFSNP